ncbi:unnamed protein product [Penicillium nalgiovense]|uniref:Uncharacterized protein n=3 Tax=Penicillium TaxID=5073 RepID=A0A9W4ID02_9EURO|nr:unnamed protein product [Penicillium salamii]CAG7953069.1 unnamed protein product [Penicillium nalgiovense]CAG7937623.1 unnamed protein product [Penicillium salamii]CAG7949261.1 unnamed protein product [Penicillium salamii]CAG7970967.1 unnamed protein product [Penicillium nalgiovense]
MEHRFTATGSSHWSSVGNKDRMIPHSSLRRPGKRVQHRSCPLIIALILTLIATAFFLPRLFWNGLPSNLFLPADTPPTIKIISDKHDKVFATGCLSVTYEIQRSARMNAAFVVLVRNQELDGILQSIRSIERHFNQWFHYPYVFLNDADFDEEFKAKIKRHVSAPVEFGKVESTLWDFPDWVDPEIAREGIQKQGDADIMYGGMESYHLLQFYKHPLLLKYEWYWRLEPEIKYFCDITYDPFVKMAEANKTYGFTIAIKELQETVPNLFRYASAYKRTKGIKSKGLWEMFLNRPSGIKLPSSEDEKWNSLPEDITMLDSDHVHSDEICPDAMEGESYNLCHFWSNFEIARLDWYQSKECQEFFEMMERSGGFWMERWGDAPIHSLAAGILLSPDDVHYFRDIGYRHTTIQHCPANAPARQLPRAPFLDQTIEDEKERLEEDEYWANFDSVRENGVGCRCRCDTDVVDAEDKEGSCFAEWVDVAGGWTSP